MNTLLPASFVVEENNKPSLIKTGIVPDAAQAALITQLDRLAKNLQKNPKSSWWNLRRKDETIKGLYIYGQVGRGKTMLMDMFYDALMRRDKMRVHFNDFMYMVQNKLTIQRQRIITGKTKNPDPIPPVAAALAKKAKILCFDEFSVTDIADAMILGRLFTHLFSHGVVLVATSNVHPDDLYMNGLNRALFMPFITLLKQQVDLFNLDGTKDYRLEKAIGQSLYLTPLGQESAKQMQAAFAKVSNDAPAMAEYIETGGRRINIPAVVGKVARFDFSDLCAKPLGAHDYALLAQKYRCFFIENVPIFDNSMRNEAKRFILLIDTLYQAQRQLFISAAAPPDRLYFDRGATTESFEFARTASRLYEMQSDDYTSSFSKPEKDEV